MEYIEKENIRKSKRNRHPTSCLAKTKGGAYDTCPFCGSKNLAEHGVEWCDICDKTYDVFRVVGEYWYSRACPDKDTHPKIYNKITRRYFRHTQMDKITVEVCMDCGAINTGVCPNCDKNNHLSKPEDFSYKNRRRSKAWKNNIGKVACTRCNFRSK